MGGAKIITRNNNKKVAHFHTQEVSLWFQQTTICATQSLGSEDRQPLAGCSGSYHFSTGQLRPLLIVSCSQETNLTLYSLTVKPCSRTVAVPPPYPFVKALPLLQGVEHLLSYLNKNLTNEPKLQRALQLNRRSHLHTISHRWLVTWVALVLEPGKCMLAAKNPSVM